MYKVKCETEGFVPLRGDKLTASTIKIMTDAKGDRRTLKDLKEDAPNKLYKDEIGVYCPSKWLLGSIKNGLIGLRSNRQKITAKISKGLFFVPLKSYFYNGKIIKKEDGILEEFIKDWKGNTKIAYYPYIKEGWKLKFEITVPWDFLTPEVLKEGVTRAGYLFAIGNRRPEYGRFTKKEFELS